MEQMRWWIFGVQRSEGRHDYREDPSRIHPNVLSTGKSEVTRWTSSFSIADLKQYDIAEKTIHYTQVIHVVDKPEIVNAEAKENFEKAVSVFIVDLKTLMQKTLVDPKLLQLKFC